MDVWCLFMDNKKPETRNYEWNGRINGCGDAEALLRVQGHVESKFRLKLFDLVKKEAQWNIL